MRGTDHQQSAMFSYISAEQGVPKDHPLRALQVMADAALAQLGPAFDVDLPAQRAPLDRAGEIVARALAAGAVRDAQRAAPDRAARLQLPVPLVSGAEHRRPVWTRPCFIKNRERLLEEVVNYHSEKALRRRLSKRGRMVNGAATSSTNRLPIPRARLARKGAGKEAKLSYAGHVLMQNRNGIAVNGYVTQANGRAEPQAAIATVEAIPGWHR